MTEHALPTAGHAYSPDESAFMYRGACRSYDPRLWDTDTRKGKTAVRGKSLIVGGTKISRAEAIEFAKNVCSSCPVRLECRAFIGNHPQDEGIWAGLLPEER